MSGTTPQPSGAARLRELIVNARHEKRCILLPSCHDALSAAMIERAGFEVCFMSGFAVSATSLALPDAGLISYGEQLTIGRNVCEAARHTCVIGDGDTGFGTSANIRRTIEGYARAGFSGISIEDQVYPKRCSHALGLSVVPRAEAVTRVRAALAARDNMRAETGLDLVVVARTDCRNAAVHGGLDEALARCLAFEELGADVVYAEGLASKVEMAMLNKAVQRTPTMLAQVERPGVALVTTEEAAALGYALSLRGLTVLNASLAAMKGALAAMASGAPMPPLLSFDELYRDVGFDDHYAWEARFEGKLAS